MYEPTTGLHKLKQTKPSAITITQSPELLKELVMLDELSFYLEIISHTSNR